MSDGLGEFGDLLRVFILQSRDLAIIRANLTHSTEMSRAAELVLEFYLEAGRELPPEVVELLDWAKNKEAECKEANDKQAERVSKAMMNARKHAQSIRGIHTAKGVH